MLIPVMGRSRQHLPCWFLFLLKHMLRSSASTPGPCSPLLMVTRENLEAEALGSGLAGGDFLDIHSAGAVCHLCWPLFQALDLKH